jgi:spermidine/putrescine transport system permease protein
MSAAGALRRLPLTAYGIGVLLLLYAPLLVVAVFSFNESRFGVTWKGFSWKWDQQLAENEEVQRALINTLIVGCTATTISTVIGTLLAIGLARHLRRFKHATHALLMVPVIAPDVVMGVSLLLLYAGVREVTGLLNLGLGTVILSHIAFQVSYVAIVVASRLSQLDPALPAAARDLGAGPGRSLWHVTLPLLRPAIAAAALLALTLSIDDVVVTFFTSGPGSTTLPVYIFSSVRRGISPEIHALSTCFIVVTGLIILPWAILTNRNKEP